MRFPPPQPVRIAISGKMGAGKSTLAAGLATHFNAPILSFASGFKRLVEDAGVTKERNEALYRKLCQNIGGGMRLYDEDIWVKAFWTRFRDVATASYRIPHVAPCIVDDMRYPNEFESLAGGGFYTVRLEVPAAVRATRRQLIDHESETALDQYAVDGRFDLHLYLEGYEPPELVYERVIFEFAADRQAAA